MFQKNLLKEKMARGQVCIGNMFPFDSTGFVELIGKCNIDFVTFDSEHGPLDYSQIEDLTRACELNGITPLCRIPSPRPEIILRTMDAGVMGIVCPHVKSKDIAEQIVTYVKYPPQGKRGLAMTARAPGYSGMIVEDYIKEANEETMVIIQIEDPEGVDNLESILSVKGIDAVFLGRADLTLSMGYQGNVKAPEVQEAIEKVVTITSKHGIQLMVATDEVEGIYWINRGAKLLSMHIVPFIRRKLSEATKIVHDEGKRINKF
jgi:2-keto-3-deoxy-L-rhamnonate aldolase RhmA